MLVRERWMLCLTWLLGWDGLDEGAMGAGGTGRFLVSLSSTGPEDGFWPGVDADTWLDEGWDPDCFFGITYVVLVTISAPVSWCLGAEVDGDCMTGARLDFAGLGRMQGSDSADCCFDTPLLNGSFAFSWEWLCGGAGSVTEWEEGAASVEVSSGDCSEGVKASLSASISLLSCLAEKRTIRNFVNMKKYNCF